jgi:sulfate permease, SulP family
MRYRFDRSEAAGSLGDLGTLLPLAIGMILLNGLSPVGLFFSIGLYYILSGVYFGTTVPVQPMKVIGAYAIATAMTAPQILASGLLIGVFLLLLGATGLITVIGRYIPTAVVRGVQLSTGSLLMAQGVRFMVGTSTFQTLQGAAEPYLTLQALGPVPIGIVIGIAGGLLTLFLLDNRRFPAGLVLIFGGILLGATMGTREGLGQLRIGFYLPEFLPFGIPTEVDFSFALLVLVLPQMPMTVGNAVVAYADLSKEYFGEDSKRVTYRAVTISMGLANLACFLVGGMPLCHGAGGLAAHYRFGARTAGSNLIVGALFLLLAMFLGPYAIGVFHLLPMALLGVLLLFAGSQLALTILDLTVRKDLFIALLVLGITLASNLAAGFLAGIAVAYLARSEKLSV